MKRVVFSTILLILVAGWSFSQNESDALRYSQIFYGGTARSLSMGGAFGALGADFSSLSINPAGLGVYRKSEFTITPTILYNKSGSNFYNTKFDDFAYDLGLSNIGIVGTFNSHQEHGWISTNIAFGYNRMNNFDFNTTIKRVDATSSLVDEMVNNANDYGWYLDNYNNHIVVNNPVSQIAADNQLIYLNDTTETSLFRSDFTGTNYGQSQRRSIESQGYMGEYVISIASNFDHKIYLGGTVGIQTVNFTEHFNHVEDDVYHQIDYLNSFTYQQELKTKGTGVNFKFGVIGKPFDWLRIGGAVHSPTFFGLTDKYYYEVNSDLTFDNGGPVTYYGENDYDLTTPLRAIGSLAIVYNKIAIVSFDYEFVDYSTMRLRNSGDGYDFEPENSGIQEHYTSTGNLRTGAELRFGPISLRGGYAYYASPYASGQDNEKADYSLYSGGLGINNDNFFLDLAYIWCTHREKYFLYEPEMPATLDLNSNKILVTFGLRF
jgi:hypothetical protein